MEGSAGARQGTIAALWTRPPSKRASSPSTDQKVAKPTGDTSLDAIRIVDLSEEACREPPVDDETGSRAPDAAICVGPDITPVAERGDPTSSKRRSVGPSDSTPLNKRARVTTKGEHAALDLQQTTTEASASAPAPVDTDAKVQEDPADLGQAMSQLGKEGLLEHLSNRRAGLMGTGMPAPLQTLPEEGSASTTRIPYSDAQLASRIAWQPLPLARLVEALLPLFSAPGSNGARMGHDVLMSRICLLAARKSFASKKSLDPLLNALEDTSSDCLWRWDLRESRLLPHGLRARGAAAKKEAKLVQDSLTALDALTEVLKTQAEGDPPTAKLHKVWDAWRKTQVHTPTSQAAAVAASPAPAEKLSAPSVAAAAAALAPPVEDKARLQAEKDAVRAAEKKAREDAKAAALQAKVDLKAAREAERATAAAAAAEARTQARAEREAERERQRAEQEAEKERQRAEREAERERQREEQELAKLSRKTGFKDGQELGKARDMFKSFFGGKSPGPASTPPSSGRGATVDLTTPAAAGSTPAHARATLVGRRLSMAGTPGAAGPRGLTPNTGGQPAARERGYAELFLKPEGEPGAVPPPARGDSMDAELARGLGEAESERAFGEWLVRARAQRRAATLEPRLGLPPSWARRRGAAEAARERYHRLRDDGVDPAQVRTWRRKLLWFPADSARPAFHGSCSGAPRGGVGPRRPWARDPVLDYEVMSDLDWEEEPEGTSLSGDDESDTGGCGEESDAEGGSFMVADGYLSEDEGIQWGDEFGVEDAAQEVASSGAREGARPGLSDADMARLRKALQLGALLERAKRAGQPLIISRLPRCEQLDQAGAAESAAETAATSGGHLSADVSLLDAFAFVHGPCAAGVRVRAPETGVGAGGAGPTWEAADPNQGASGAGSSGPADADAGAGRIAEPAAKGSKPRSGAKQWDRPEELMPELLRLVLLQPGQTKKEYVDAFIAAHPDLHISRAWVLGRLGALVEFKGRTATLTPLALDPVNHLLAEFNIDRGTGSVTGPSCAQTITSSTPAPEPKPARQQRTLPAVLRQRAEAAAATRPPVRDWAQALTLVESGTGPALAALPTQLAALLSPREDDAEERGPGAPGPIPAFLSAAVVERLAADGPAREPETVEPLAATLHLLLGRIAEGAGACTHEDASASQMAWAAPRAGPLAATLETVACEARLAPALRAALRAGGAAAASAEGCLGLLRRHRGIMERALQGAEGLNPLLRLLEGDSPP
uniref:Chromatin assembly factor 1 subunit A dimerization domain-containing protein n=1 Tax=Auxenochlorella protothecoides TaxID=3075 RepID=A0A1D2ABW9_AUXPR